MSSANGRWDVSGTSPGPRAEWWYTKSRAGTGSTPTIRTRSLRCSAAGFPNVHNGHFGDVCVPAGVVRGGVPVDPAAASLERPRHGVVDRGRLGPICRELRVPEVSRRRLRLRLTARGRGNPTLAPKSWRRNALPREDDGGQMDDPASGRAHGQAHRNLSAEHDRARSR